VQPEPVATGLVAAHHRDILGEAPLHLDLADLLAQCSDIAGGDTYLPFVRYVTERQPPLLVAQLKGHVQRRFRLVRFCSKVRSHLGFSSQVIF
jgi:hypothetical protein